MWVCVKKQVRNAINIARSVSGLNILKDTSFRHEWYITIEQKVQLLLRHIMLQLSRLQSPTNSAHGSLTDAHSQFYICTSTRDLSHVNKM